MRRVNARPWLGEAGVVVVAAGRQDIILSSRALVPGTDLPCAHAPGFPDVDAKHLRAFANKFQQTSQEGIPHRQSHKNSHPRSASRSMLHILGRCYALGENSLSVCGIRSHRLSNSPQVKMALCAYSGQRAR